MARAIRLGLWGLCRSAMGRRGVPPARWMLRLLLLLSLAVGVPAQAHGIYLLQCSPASSARLPDAPPEIRLWFSEALLPDGSAINLIAAGATVLDLPDARIDPDDPSLLKLAPGELGAGVYVVSWRAVSGVDGHPARGSYAFSIGAGESSPGEACDSGESLPLMPLLVRGGLLAGLALLLGGAAFAPLMGVHRRWMWAGWLLVGSAAALNLFWSGAPDSKALLIALFWLQTGFALRFAGQQSLSRWIVPGLSLTLLALISLEMGGGRRILPADTAAKWLHLFAALLWLGALIYLLLLRSTEAVRRFRDLSLLSIGLAALSGAYLTWLQAGSPDALPGTLYGRLLLIKLGLLILLASFWLLNRRSFPWRWPAAGGAVLVFVLSILIGAANPARDVYALRLALPAAPEPQPFFDSALVADLQVQLEIDPGLVGENRFYVILFDREDGSRIDDAGVQFLKQHEATAGERAALALLPQGDGVYSAVGLLDQPGAWQLQARVSRSASPDVVVDFTAPVELPPPPEASFVDTRIPQGERLPFMLGAGILLLGMGGCFFWRRRGSLLGASALLTGLLLIFGGLG